MSVLGRDGDWYRVNYDGKTGYMAAAYVTLRASAGDLRCVARVTSDGLNLRPAAGTSGGVLASASRGEYVDVSGFENGWFRVQYSGKTGYMSGDYLTLAAARPAASAPSPAPAPSVPASGNGADIAALARSFVGKAPYLWQRRRAADGAERQPLLFRPLHRRPAHGLSLTKQMKTPYPLDAEFSLCVCFFDRCRSEVPAECGQENQ